MSEFKYENIIKVIKTPHADVANLNLDAGWILLGVENGNFLLGWNQELGSDFKEYKFEDMFDIKEEPVK